MIDHVILTLLGQLFLFYTTFQCLNKFYGGLDEEHGLGTKELGKKLSHLLLPF